MTHPAPAYTNPRTAEFARLFAVFDRVATRRTRAIAGDTSEAISADDIAAVPAEFSPLLKNLSTVLAMRAQRDHSHRPATSNLSNGRTGEEGRQSFPLKAGYPFTFKLMLHRLYDLDEWVDKVKNALESSKSQFKPLGEKVQSLVKDAAGKEKTNKKGVSRAKSYGTLAGSARTRALGAREGGHGECNRALKKRCVGRRKSVSGPVAAEVWVYDAAISAVEVDGSRPAVEITLCAHKEGLAGHEDACGRRRSLAALENIQSRDTTRRKVKVAIPLTDDENCSKAASGVASVLSNGGPHKKGIPRKRRAMESINNMGGVARYTYGHDMASTFFS